MEERLVAEIKKHKAIYDKVSRTSYNKKAWLSISRALKIPVVVCKFRWINLQEQYVKELQNTQNESGSIAESNWEFFGLMDFLRQYVQPPKEEISSADAMDPLLIAKPDSFEEKLIEEIKKRKFFYDKSCPTYGNRLSHASAWKTISEVLEIPAIVCKTRWRSLRDRYFFERQKLQKALGSGTDVNESRWEYYELLDFLRHYVQPKKQVKTSVADQQKWFSSAEPVCNEEELIKEIKKHKSLYDKSSPAYGNRNTNAKTWRTISKALDIPVLVCKSRWLKLQDRYEKELQNIVNASGSGADDYESEWEYFELMDFLREHVEPLNLVNDSKKWFTSAETVTRFIEEVKKHKTIFDKTRHTYNNKMIRAKVWLSISDSLEISVEACQYRWKFLRDRYINELENTQNASGSGADDCESQWEYFESMDFLREYVKPKKPITITSVTDSAKKEQFTSAEDKLIGEIKKHETIYNRNFPTYGNRITHAKVWHSISKALGTPPLVCKTRWRSLRDRYVREIQKVKQAKERGDDVYQSHWEHFELMDFLREYMQPVKELNNVHNSKEWFSSDETVFNVEKLIEEIQKHKWIFDNTHRAFQITKSWQAISHAMKTPVHICKSQWLSLKERYERELQNTQQSSGSGSDGNESQWEYFKLMEFLRQYLEPIKKELSDSKDSISSVSMEEKLIEQVKRHKSIYDNSRRATHVSIAWQAISHTLKIPVSACKSRWVNLKERYEKELQNTKQASGSDSDTNESQWEYFESMDFLRQYVDPIKKEMTTSVPDSKDSICLAEPVSIEEQLIEQIKRHKSIFDKSRRSYHISIAWQAISHALKIPVPACKSRWLNLQDRYEKELQNTLHASRTNAGVYKSNWEYFELMGFLRPYMEPIKLEMTSLPDRRKVSEPINMEERLVREIKKHKCIFNKSSSNYDNKIALVSAWESISEALHIPVAMCQCRWRSLRECYLKECKKTQRTSGRNDGKHKSRWEFFELMDFLRHYEQPINEMTSVPDSKDSFPVAEPVSMETKLVEEIKKHKSIFDKNCPNYDSRIVRVAAWHSISESLGIPVSMCQCRWRTLRDQYLQEYEKMKQTSENGYDSYESSWEYFELMDFLREYMYATIKEVSDTKDSSTIDESVSMERKLIEAIKKHKSLFDKSRRIYHNKKLWKSISRSLGIPVGACKVSWRSVRDRYKRELQKTQYLLQRGGIVYKSRWENYELMDFLRHTDQPNKKETSVTDSKEWFTSAEPVNVEQHFIEDTKKHKATDESCLSDPLGIPECHSRVQDPFVKESLKAQHATECAAVVYENSLDQLDSKDWFFAVQEKEDSPSSSPTLTQSPEASAERKKKTKRRHSFTIQSEEDVTTEIPEKKLCPMQTHASPKEHQGFFLMCNDLFKNLPNPNVDDAKVFFINYLHGQIRELRDK